MGRRRTNRQMEEKRIRTSLLSLVHLEEGQPVWYGLHLPSAQGRIGRDQGRGVRQVRLQRVLVWRLTHN